MIAQYDGSVVRHTFSTSTASLHSVFGTAFCGKLFIPVFVTLGQLVEKLTLEDANTADDLRRLFLSVFRQESGLKSNKMYHTH